MSAFDNPTFKTVATGIVAIAIFTASVMSVMAAPAGKAATGTKVAVHAQTVRKIAIAKKGVGARKLAAHKKGAKTAILSRTVLPEIVVGPAAAKTVATANPAFRKHFFRGQA